MYGIKNLGLSVSSSRPSLTNGPGGPRATRGFGALRLGQKDFKGNSSINRNRSAGGVGKGFVIGVHIFMEALLNYFD